MRTTASWTWAKKTEFRMSREHGIFDLVTVNSFVVQTERFKPELKVCSQEFKVERFN
jgi:hypothetical protein